MYIYICIYIYIYIYIHIHIYIIHVYVCERVNALFFRFNLRPINFQRLPRGVREILKLFKIYYLT